VASLSAQKPKDRPAKAPSVSAGTQKAPKGPAPNGAPRLNKKGGERLPRTPVDRFNRMTPEDRQRALEKLPPERRKKFEEQLKHYNSLTPAERREERSRYQA